jgi:hypothetical protein
MWSEQLSGGLATERVRDLRAAAPETRGRGVLAALRARVERSRGGTGFDDPVAVVDGVTIRRSHAGDRAALHRLAQLDSRRLAEGELLVAEVDGELRAALPLEGGTAIADPFRPTAPLVSLLGLRAAQIRAAESEAERGEGAEHATPLYVPHSWSAR